MSKWFRWYAGTVEDGKFRYVARNAGVTLPTVIALWAALLEDASNDDHRGVVTRNEDFFAAILDLEDGIAEQILSAMQSAGLISVGHGAITILRWNERQFETDKGDGTNAERQKRYRSRRKQNEQVAAVTPLRNGTVTAQRTDTDTDTDTESISAVARTAEPSACKPRATRLGSDWKLPDDWRQWARINFATATDAMVSAEADQFRDFWISKAGREAAKLDWGATWRNWCRNSRTLGAAPKGSPINNGRMAWDEKKAKTAYLPTPRNREISPEERERIAMEMERMN